MEIKLTLFFVLTLFFIRPVFCQDTIAVHETPIEYKGAVFGLKKTAKTLTVSEYKLGQKDWAEMNQNGKKALKPILTSFPDAKKYWRRHRWNSGIADLGQLSSHVGNMFFSAWLINEIDDGSGKIKYLYWCGGLNIGGMLVRNIFKKKAAKNIKKSIDAYNYAILKN